MRRSYDGISAGVMSALRRATASAPRLSARTPSASRGVDRPFRIRPTPPTYCATPSSMMRTAFSQAGEVSSGWAMVPEHSPHARHGVRSSLALRPDAAKIRRPRRSRRSAWMSIGLGERAGHSSGWLPCCTHTTASMRLFRPCRGDPHRRGYCRVFACQVRRCAYAATTLDSRCAPLKSRQPRGIRLAFGISPDWGILVNLHGNRA